MNNSRTMETSTKHKEKIDLIKRYQISVHIKTNYNIVTQSCHNLIK